MHSQTILHKEVLDMAKTANIFVRVEPEIKEQAEKVLDQLALLR